MSRARDLANFGSTTADVTDLNYAKTLYDTGVTGAEFDQLDTTGTAPGAGNFLRGDKTWQAITTADVYVSSFSRDVSTATGTQAVTGVGFTPTSIEVFAAIGGTVKASWGMSDGTTHRCIYQNNNGGTDFLSNQSQLIRVVTVDTVTMYSGTLDSFDADGFTISWTKTGSPTGTVAGNFIARK